jgi:hypothetical protein
MSGGNRGFALMYAASSQALVTPAQTRFERTSRSRASGVAEFFGALTFRNRSALGGASTNPTRSERECVRAVGFVIFPTECERRSKLSLLQDPIRASLVSTAAESFQCASSASVGLCTSM